MINLSANQKEFVDQFTRKLLVEWCDTFLRTGQVEIVDSFYKSHAIDKGWVSSKSGVDKILSTGWQSAARFLKR